MPAIVAVFLAGVASEASAAAKVASAGANWTTATWTPVGVPTSADTCTINSGVNLTINTAAVCGALTIGNATNSSTTLTLAAGGSLSITTAGGQSGNLVLNPNNLGRTFTVAAGTQTVTVDGTFTTGTAGTNRITVSTGQVNFTNAAGITWPTRGTLTVTGNNAGGSVNFAGLVSQAGGTISNTTAAGTLNFNGGYTKTGGTFTTMAGETLNFGGNLTVSTAALTFNATSTANFTNTATVTPTAAITFGNLAINPGAASTVTLGGNVTAAGNLTVNSGTFDLATFTAARTVAGGTLTIANGATMLVGGANNYPANYTTDALGPTSTVAYDGAAQTVVTQAAPGYGNLTLSGSSGKTLPAAAMPIQGNFTMAGTASATAGGALTVGGNFVLGAGTAFTAGAFNHTVSGNFDATGTFTVGTSTVTLNGTAAQTISGASPVTFNNLTVTNAANPNITLATNVTVTTLTGTATLTTSCPDYTLTSVTPAQVLHSCPTVVNSINRANPDPTSAATVSWTVTFNQSVTGVDATAFTLVPSGVSGAYITTVAGSGTTWTVTANTGIGSGTLRLDQTGPGSVVPPLSGTFTTGQFYTITSTPALAEYRMDEASWNGTAGEVVDSSGSGNHAQAFNSASTAGTTPAIATNPGTCRYGVFDNGGTITQGYVQTPLPDLTTDFTFAAWIRTTNNAATGQRILIDDQNNTGGYGLSLGDGAAGILRFYSRGITPVILDSTYTIANNTWYFVAAVADITNKKRTLYVFDTAGALLNSTTEAAWTGGAWGTDAGPVSIGGEVNGPPQTESPATFHFRGNLDEVRVYQKVLSQTALAAIAAQTHACPVNIPDHFEIHSSGTGMTCTPSTLTVVACADATCATPYTLGVTGTLGAAGAPMVNWDGTTGGAAGAGFDIPVGGSSVTKDVQVTTPGNVVFSIASATPGPLNATTCNFGTPSCTFTAADAGFLVSAPSHVAETASTLTVQAVKKADNSLACVPAFASVAKTVNLKCAYVNPATGTLPVRVGGAALNATNNAAAACDGSGGSVSLSFNASGIATPSLQYADAGSMQVNASFVGTAGTKDAGLNMTGSGTFIAAPALFGFSGIPAGLIKAGNNFSATVTAYNGLGAATPNFGKETAPEGVTLVSNLASGNNPTLANNVIAGGAFANGIATVNNLSWGEVGIITLTANLTSGSYLVSGLTATGTSSNVGRHTPDHFDTITSGGMLCPSGLTCPTQFNGFVYSGQPFTTNVIARNLGGVTTLNYDNGLGYSKAVMLTAWDAKGSTTTQNPPAATPGALGSNAVLAAAFTNGATTTGTPATPTYTLPNPYPSPTPTSPTDIYIRAVDADAVTSLLAIPANSVEGGMKIVSGRMKVSNAHGSELLTLPIGVTVQYWDGTNYVTSATDSLTTFASTNVVFANWQKNLTAGSTTASPASVVFANGAGSFNLSAPGAGKNGSVDLTTNAPSYLPSNTARATFGVYKGNNNFIYLRESY